MTVLLMVSCGTDEVYTNFARVHAALIVEVRVVRSQLIYRAADV